MKDNTWSCANRLQKIQKNSPSAHFGPATAQNSSSLWPNLSLTSTSLESKYPLSSASVSLEMILVVFPVGFVRKKLNCNLLIFGFLKETVSTVLLVARSRNGSSDLEFFEESRKVLMKSRLSKVCPGGFEPVRSCTLGSAVQRSKGSVIFLPGGGLLKIGGGIRYFV